MSADSAEEIATELLEFATEQIQAAQDQLVAIEGSAQICDVTATVSSPGAVATKGDESDKENEQKGLSLSVDAAVHEPSEEEDNAAALQLQQRNLLDAKLSRGSISAEEHQKMVAGAQPLWRSSSTDCAVNGHSCIWTLFFTRPTKPMQNPTPPP